MKTSLSHIPERKRDELISIVKIILAIVKPEMIILFGSYARGDFVVYDAQFDRDTGRKLSYASDFDILVIVRSEKVSDDFKIWNRVEKQIRKNICTSISLIVETMDHVNEMLSVGRYFYADIKKEGIALYDTKKFQLARARKLDAGTKRLLAEEDYKIWIPKAKQLFEGYKFYLEKHYNNIAAFTLHQITEALLSATSLVLTTYKPKTHDLERLTERMEKIDLSFAEIFPRENKKEKRLFELLRKAYVDARYSKTYKITKGELTYLAERVKKLRRLSLKKCREKMMSF